MLSGIKSGGRFRARRPRFYLGKDEVECGNTALMTLGGPAVRMRQMGQYFQAVLCLYSTVIKIMLVGISAIVFSHV